MFIDSYRIIESYQIFLLLHFRHIEWYNKLWCLRSSIRIGLPRGSPKFSGATPCPVSRWLSKFGAQNGAPGSPRKTNAENRVLPVMWRIMAFQVLSTQGSWGLEKAALDSDFNAELMIWECLSCSLSGFNPCHSPKNVDPILLYIYIYTHTSPGHLECSIRSSTPKPSKSEHVQRQTGFEDTW